MQEAVRILDLEKSNIIDIWEAALNEKVPAANNTNSLALRDHVPQLLEDIVEILEQVEDLSIPEEELFEKLTQHSIEHGRHRASTSLYTIDQILQEYIIFHQVIHDALADKSALSPKVNKVLRLSIENSMLLSARAFSDSLQDMRRKLVGILAHDMRNPVSAALFAIEVMKTAQGTEKMEKLRQMAQNSLKRSLDLIEGLLDSVTMGAGEGMTLDFEEIDLTKTIRAVYEEAREVYSNPIELKYEEAEIRGVFDGTMLRRMLENLISNAVKYGDREKPVTVVVENSGERVLLKVHNWGNPIPEESQKQIFTFLDSSLSNGTRKLKSWGMGLTLARAVVEAHGGVLELKSSESEGTTFSASLQKYKNRPGKKRASLNFR